MAAASPMALAGTAHAETAGPAATDWWPRNLDLSALRQNEAQSNPYGVDYDYAKEFASLDLDAVKADIRKVLTTSQPWWPADYGHYSPFFIRMTWHSVPDKIIRPRVPAESYSITGHTWLSVAGQTSLTVSPRSAIFAASPVTCWTKSLLSAFAFLR